MDVFLQMMKKYLNELRTAKKIKGELFGLRDKTFLLDLLNTLELLGLQEN